MIHTEKNIIGSLRCTAKTINWNVFLLNVCFDIEMHHTNLRMMKKILIKELIWIYCNNIFVAEKKNSEGQIPWLKFEFNVRQ